MIDYRKILYAIAAASTAAFIAACEPKPVEPDEPSVPEEPEPVTMTVNFVLPSDGAKTSWTAGDRIVIHGEYSEKQVTVTLDASDISSDGKKATKNVEGLYPYKRDDCTSTLYASWPAEAVDNLRHCFFYSKFNTTNAQLLAACNDGDTFNFQNVCGAIRFSLSESFDSFAAKSPKKERIGYEFIQVKLTDGEQNFTQYLGTPILEMTGTAGNINYIYVPDGTSLSGLVIRLIKDGDFVRIYKYEAPLDIDRGQVIDLGDITKDLDVYFDPFSSDIMDLDTDETANCYVISTPGKYKFRAVRGNDANDYLEDVSDASVIWETWNNSSEVTPGSIVTAATYAEDYMIIEVPEPLHPGNALVAALDSDGKILWSWHIWIPETGILVNNYGIYSSKMMDRNLGALVAAQAGVPAPVESFGLTYQWGRKDPFPGPDKVNSSSNATVAGMAVEQTPGAGDGTECMITLQQSIENPTLLGHSKNGDWLLDLDSSLWLDSEKTIYDPCPPGYRVPARDKNQPFHSSDLTTQKGWSESVDNYSFTLGDPVAVFPLAGYRDDYAPGNMTHAYDRAVYWTAYASADAITGYYVNVRSPNSKHALSEAGKSRAGSIRCVAE